MTDKKKKDSNSAEPQDSLVDALESIKSLLAKSDSKLAAARESIAIASNQTALGKLGVVDPGQSLELNIPVLDDIVLPAEIESATKEVSHISEQISSKIDETLAAVSEAETKPDPQVLIDYLDKFEKTLEKTMRDSLMKSVVTIEASLKKSVFKELDKIRKQIKKDFK